MPAVGASCTLNLSNIQFSENFGATFGATQLISLLATGQNQNLTVGSGANQFNNCYAATLSIANGSPTEINLTNGNSIKNPDGTFATFTDIVLFYLKNNGTAGQTITIGAGTNPVTSILSTGTENILPLGGVCLKTAFGGSSGFAVTASTACEINIACASGTASIDILILGH